MQSVRPYVSINTVKMIYYSCFHSVMTYDLLFWGHSLFSIKVWGYKRRFLESCVVEVATLRKLFFNLEILPLSSQYIISLLLFMISNRMQFLVSSDMYHIDTRQHANIRQPSVNLTTFQKGVYCLGVKVFNMFPSYIKIESDNPKNFKLVLQKVLYENSFNSLDEYF
jgi:hypothetical protein